MPRIEAEFQDRKRIVFNARGRSTVNVRESLDDGPIGYSSMEMLLAALGNCMLGTLLGHELLRDADVRSAKATLDAQMAQDPVRMASIAVHVELEVSDPKLLSMCDELEAATCGCPVCNSLKAEIHVALEMRLVAPAGAVG